jgi:hypothetical protein
MRLKETLGSSPQKHRSRTQFYFCIWWRSSACYILTHMLTTVLFLFVVPESQNRPLPCWASHKPKLQRVMFLSSMTLVYSACCNIPTVIIHVFFTRFLVPCKAVTEYYSVLNPVWNMSMDDGKPSLASKLSWISDSGRWIAEGFYLYRC